MTKRSSEPPDILSRRSASILATERRLFRIIRQLPGRVQSKQLPFHRKLQNKPSRTRPTNGDVPSLRPVVSSKGPLNLPKPARSQPSASTPFYVDTSRSHDSECALCSLKRQSSPCYLERSLLHASESALSLELQNLFHTNSK